MYEFFLAAHGIVRWLVIIAGAFAIATMLVGLLDGRRWLPGGKRAGMLFTVAIDIQLLIGLVLYFGLSPLSRAALADMGAAMRAGGDLRFFAVEHTTTMIFAFVLAHAAAPLARRARTDAVRYRRALILYGIAFVLVLAGNPWWRPLIRL